jgi:hypothetical protein
MDQGVKTMLTELPRWTEPEMVAVATSPGLATWRESDLPARYGKTTVSLDVQASDETEAKAIVRAALGDLPEESFLAST